MTDEEEEMKGREEARGSERKGKREERTKGRTNQTTPTTEKKKEKEKNVRPTQAGPGRTSATAQSSDGTVRVKAIKF